MTSIQMPQLGETIVEGTILKWLKDVGDHVDRDEPLFEISTDKVDTEVPSPVAGTVSKILVEEGATVPVGTALMEIDDGSEAAVDTSTSGGSYSGDAGSAESSASTSAASPPGSPPAVEAPTSSPAGSPAPAAA
ncbi:MAG: biotin/lipoyl-containing protein, partial [Actinomycetota bacterium]